MSDPFYGEITLFAGNFAPRNWAFCNGQLLSISSNTALFSLLGTTYGGDGRTVFALPDLRGRAAVGPRVGPGLTRRNLGQRFGVEDVTLTEAQMPAHTHGVTMNPTLGGQTGNANQNSPANGTLAVATVQNMAGLPLYSSAADDTDVEGATSTLALGTRIIFSAVTS